MSNEVERPGIRVAFANMGTGVHWRTIATGAADHILEISESNEIYFNQGASIKHLPRPDERSHFCKLFDGLILRVKAAEELDLCRHLTIPVVVINNQRRDMPFPQVLPDDTAIGRMAADYLVRRGFSRFVYIGDNSPFSSLRGAAFVAALAEAGHNCTVWNRRDRGPTSSPEFKRLALKRGGGPLAVFALNDGAASSTINHCRRAGIKVPQQVAVLAVDNDPWESRNCRTPLSSIELASYEIGLRAGELMVRLLEGHPPPEEPLLVPPLRVIPRFSTDADAVADPVLRKARGFIEANTHRTVSVDDVVTAAGSSSRRTLQRRFIEAYNTTIRDACRRARVERAKSLLHSEELSVKEIAFMTGFSSASLFCRVFRQTEGITPKAYRRRFRLEQG